MQRFLPAVLLAAMMWAGSARAAPPASPDVPERFTLTRAQSVTAACGLTVRYDGGGHSIETAGGHRIIVSFTFSAGGKSESATLMARDVNKERRNLGYRWQLIQADGFDAPKVTIEVIGKAVDVR